MTLKYRGFLREFEYGENCMALGLDSSEIPLAEELKDITGKQVSVRYCLSNDVTTFEDALTRFIGTSMGQAEFVYEDAYSDVTGYLWTDEELKVGGHDLMAELRNGEGRYLNLEVEVHE